MVEKKELHCKKNLASDVPGPSKIKQDEEEDDGRREGRSKSNGEERGIDLKLEAKKVVKEIDAEDEVGGVAASHPSSMHKVD